MDRSLDEIINERPRGGGQRSRGGRGGGSHGGGGRREPRREYDSAPRDGVRKYSQRDAPVNLNEDWVHDRFGGEDADSRRQGGREDRYARRSPERAREQPAQSETKLKVDNIHYDLTDSDLKELFARIGEVTSVRMTYDRHDRPTGTAYISYYNVRDARDAVREFDGANAMGQPIRVSFAPAGPAHGPRGRNPFDYVEKPSRSLFERIQSNDDVPTRGGNRRRSISPAKEGVDRYVPDQRTRSPIRRRGTPRESGRRPGARRENSGRPDTRRGGQRGDKEAKPMSGGRPRKTAEELDAEMNDYWGGGSGQGDAAPIAAGSEAKESQATTIQNGHNNGQAATAPINDADDIDIMVE